MDALGVCIINKPNYIINKQIKQHYKALIY